MITPLRKGSCLLCFSLVYGLYTVVVCLLLLLVSLVGYSMAPPGHLLYYSRLSLSRPRLSQKTAYLEVKIWSLFLHGNLTTVNKILWKRGEIAPGAISPLFHNIFKIPLTSGVKLHIHLLKCGCSIYFYLFIYFLSFLKSDIWS